MIMPMLQNPLAGAGMMGVTAAPGMAPQQPMPVAPPVPAMPGSPMGQPQNPFAQQILQAIAARRAAMAAGGPGLGKGGKPMGGPGLAPGGMPQQAPLPMPVGQMDFSRFGRRGPETGY